MDGPALRLAVGAALRPGVGGHLAALVGLTAPYGVRHRRCRTGGKGSGSAVWRAYVDESESNRRLDPDTYLLAAAIVHDERAVEVRDEIRGLLRPGQRKLHWRDESNEFRLEITKVVAGLPALHVIVVRACLPGEPSERRRRKCFERLAYELADRGVQRITLEARESKSNARELQHFTRLRRAQAVCAGMRLDHLPGPREPLLWIPDAVAGAVTAARTGTSEYLDQLADLVDIVALDANP